MRRYRQKRNVERMTVTATRGCKSVLVETYRGKQLINRVVAVLIMRITSVKHYCNSAYDSISGNATDNIWG